MVPMLVLENSLFPLNHHQAKKCSNNGIRRFGVSGFPTIKFFPKDNKDGEAYNGGRSQEDFITYLNARCGLKRVAGGGLTDDAGRVEALDALAAKFMSAEDKSAVMEETVAASADLAKLVVMGVRLDVI